MKRKTVINGAVIANLEKIFGGDKASATEMEFAEWDDGAAGMTFTHENDTLNTLTLQITDVINATYHSSMGRHL